MLGAIGSFAPDAAAAYRSYASSSCSGPSTFVGMLGTYFASGSGNVYCPVVDDNPSATFSASTSLNVDVYDGTSSASLTAQACVTFAGSLGSSCGSAAPSGGAFTGHTTLSPSLSSWTGYPNDYAFALVVVPANGTGVNYVKGYWQAF